MDRRAAVPLHGDQLHGSQNLSILARTIQADLHISDIQYSNVVQAFLLAYTLVTSSPAASRTVWAPASAWRCSSSGGRSPTCLLRSAAVCGCSAASVFFWGSASRELYRRAQSGGGVVRTQAAGAGDWHLYGRCDSRCDHRAAGYRFPRVALQLAHRFPVHRQPRPVLGRSVAVDLSPPQEHPLVGAEDLRLIRAASEQAVVAPAGNPWREALRSRETWLLTLSRLLTDPVWYFYLFWFPKYLGDARGMTLLQVGRIAWIVYLAADVGCILGGLLSGKLIQRGFAPAASRVRVMAIAAVLLPLSPLVPRVSSPLLAVMIAATAVFAHLAWQTSLSTLVVDLYPKRIVGTVFGIVAAGSGLGGMISTNLIGRLVTHYSYTPVFIGMGFLHPLAFLLIRTLRKGRPASHSV